MELGTLLFYQDQQGFDDFHAAIKTNKKDYTGRGQKRCRALVKLGCPVYNP